MHVLERLSRALRHSPLLKNADWLWGVVRPQYNRLITFMGKDGLVRVINGTDTIRVLPKFRDVSETYEPEVWHHLMAHVKPGYVIADVGAYIGLYTIALAKRVAPAGKVVAFEPSPATFNILKDQVLLNAVYDYVESIPAAVGAQEKLVAFNVNRDTQSHIIENPTIDAEIVQCRTLDSVFVGRYLDILKIDVEGYEEEVLKGGIELLQDAHRSPKIIYIEVHPYAWWSIGTTSDSLLSLLKRCNYKVEFLNGQLVEKIDQYGEVIAYKWD
jgi:FkbM family methyltransferase